MAQQAYEKLAHHLSSLGLGLPYRDDLLAILRENLTPEEAEAAALLPTGVGPLEPVGIERLSAESGRPAAQLSEVLERLAGRGLLFSGKTPEGTKGYALHQVGFGFPQSFFWSGEHTDRAKRMTQLVMKYFSRDVTREAFGSAETKPYRYIPVEKSLSAEPQAVFSNHMMETVLERAQTFALAHCPCRVQADLLGRGCEHPLEVCLKFDDMAEYLIERGLGREVTRDEAREVVRKSAEAGLVHFVDNAAGAVKHNCNCCGCSCWNVGTIKRRKIPRDALMATYFLRTTAEDKCTGCGECVDVCPVDAVKMSDGLAVVDEEWCIGCGVCVPRCNFGAIELRPREDRGALPEDFRELHRAILAEKGLV